MTEVLQFLIDYGYIVLFLWVALDQAALPIPSVPLLVAAGALAGIGELSLGIVFAVTLVASVPINQFWFWLGRLRGSRVLHLLCILSLEPDYCVRNTENLFRRLGSTSVLVAKFVPGLQLLAPPMSGLTGMPLQQFFWLNLIGSILWASAFILPGYFFHAALEEIVRNIADAGSIAGIFLGSVVLLYFGVKLVKRHLFVRTLKMRKVDPVELFERLQEGGDVHILDLRHEYDLKAIPHLLPNSSRLAMESVAENLSSIPRDKDIILCCS